MYNNKTPWSPYLISYFSGKKTAFCYDWCLYTEELGLLFGSFWIHYLFLRNILFHSLFCSFGFVCFIICIPGHALSPGKESRWGLGLFRISFNVMLLTSISEKLFCKLPLLQSFGRFSDCVSLTKYLERKKWAKVVETHLSTITQKRRHSMQNHFCFKIKA